MKKLTLIIWNILKSQEVITALWLFGNTLSGIIFAGLADQGLITAGIATAFSAFITKLINKKLTEMYEF